MKRGRERVETLLLWLAIAAYAGLVLWKAWVSDDAYITLRTVANFLNGDGLRWNVDERVQSYTHPLWMLLLAVACGVTHEFFFTTMVVGALVSLAAVAVVGWKTAPSRMAGVVAVVLLAFSRSFTDYSTSGLENPLTHLVLAAFAAVLFMPAGAARRILWLNAIAALLLVTRLDALWLVLPALIVEVVRARRVLRWKWLVAAWSPFLAWEAFSILYYGFPLPNTAYAKLGSDLEAGLLAQQGGWYVFTTLVDDPSTVLTILAGLVCVAWRRDGRQLALAAGIGLDLAYVVRIGGDFMAGRFLTPPLVMAVVLLARAALQKRAIAGAALAGVAALCFTSYAPWRGVHVPEAAEINGWGVADERLVYDECCSLFGRRGVGPWPNPDSRNDVPDLRRDWDRDRFVAKLKSMGIVTRDDELPASSAGQRVQPLVLRGAVGYMGFFLGPSIHVMDIHALADPLLARLPAERRDPLTVEGLAALKNRGWRIGHFVRKVPKGYAATIVTGTNHIADADLASYYDDLRAVTAGPLLAWSRMRAIARLNLHRRDPRIERFVARQRAMQPAERAPAAPESPPRP